MDELRRGYVEGSRLAVLVGPEVPTRALTTISSMASKVGYVSNDVRFFVFDKSKKGMIGVALADDFVGYTTDSASMLEHFN